MKIKHYLLQKPSILIWVSVLSGFFVTSEEIMDCIELSRIRGIDPDRQYIIIDLPMPVFHPVHSDTTTN